MIEKERSSILGSDKEGRIGQGKIVSSELFEARCVIKDIIQVRQGLSAYGSMCDHSKYQVVNLIECEMHNAAASFLIATHATQQERNCMGCIFPPVSKLLQPTNPADST